MEADVKKFILAFIILFASFAQAEEPISLARMAPAIGVMGGGAAAPGCLATVEPAGDIFSDGFEGTGTGGYENESGWTESGTADQAYDISALTTGDDAKNGCYGLNVNLTGTTISATYDSGSARELFYLELSFYIQSESFADADYVDLLIASTAGAGGGTALVKIKIIQTSGSVKIYADSGGTDSTLRVIETGKWYYVRLYAEDLTDGSGNGDGTIRVGTTYNGTDIANDDAYTLTNVNDASGRPRYFAFGGTGAETINITLGYVAVDSDGTF